MATDGGERRGPLWRFVPHVAHVPQVRGLAGATVAGAPPRAPRRSDPRPLRERGEWSPAVIVRRFGPASGEAEQLARLVVACAAIGGPHRVRELCERLGAHIAIAYPRVARMIDEPALARRKELLERLVAGLDLARRELPATRARANNDLERSHPDGLRMVDLAMLVEHASAVILAAEVANTRNPSGLEHALRAATSLPEQRYVESWLDRLLGTAQPSGVLLMTPHGYGRVVIVFEDGRLAYDPGAPAEDEDPDEAG